MADSFLAWVDVTAYCAYKRGMLHAALRYYRLNRQRASLHALRWNVMRRRLKRAVALRGRLGVSSKALQVQQVSASASFCMHVRVHVGACNVVCCA